MDSATLALAVGLIVSLAFTEAFGLAAGGMIVPGYLALYVRQPVNIVLTLIAALVTFAVVRLISRYTIIYGRRRVVIAILFGFLVGSLMRGGIQWCQMAWPESAAAGSCVCVIGFIIPGLIALWMDRQGVAQTMAPLMTSTVVVRLVLIIIGMEAVQ